jgi:hypothetical protein
MRSRRLLTPIIVLILVWGMTGCASGPEPRLAAAPLEMDAAGGVARVQILSARLGVTVPEVAPAAARAEELVQDLGGMAQRTDLEEGRAHLYLRVPAPDLETALDRLGSLGQVHRREVSSLDVTEEQIDLKARLDNLTLLRDSLRQLLDRAETVKDILEVQRELTRVQSEIDSLTARLTHLQGRVAMAAIDLELKPKVTLGPVAWVGNQVYQVVSKLFVW